MADSDSDSDAPMEESTLARSKNETTAVKQSSDIPANTPQPQESLIHEFKYTFDLKTEPDFTVILKAKDKPIVEYHRVHKAVLCAHSAFFREATFVDMTKTEIELPSGVWCPTTCLLDDGCPVNLMFGLMYMGTDFFGSSGITMIPPPFQNFYDARMRSEWKKMIGELLWLLNFVGCAYLYRSVQDRWYKFHLDLTSRIFSESSNTGYFLLMLCDKIGDFDFIRKLLPFVKKTVIKESLWKNLNPKTTFLMFQHT